MFKCKKIFDHLFFIELRQLQKQIAKNINSRKLCTNDIGPYSFNWEKEDENNIPVDDSILKYYEYKV